MILTKYYRSFNSTRAIFMKFWFIFIALIQLYYWIASLRVLRNFRLDLWHVLNFDL